jgi:iron complex outermembrane recepter protein
MTTLREVRRIWTGGGLGVLLIVGLASSSKAEPPPAAENPTEDKTAHERRASDAPASEPSSDQPASGETAAGARGAAGDRSADGPHAPEQPATERAARDAGRGVAPIDGAASRPGTAASREADQVIEAGAEVIEIEDQIVPGPPSSRFDVLQRDVPATVTAVTAAELAERGTVDFSGAIQHVPGASAHLTYGGFDFVTLRGFSDVVMLLDGVRDERHTVVTSAPMGSLVGVERVELLKGPASVLYGLGALGGIVNVSYRQPSAQPGAELTTAIGSYDDRRASMGLTGPLGTVARAPVLYRLDLGTATAGDFRGADVSRTASTLALAWAPSPWQRVAIRGSWFRNRYATDAGLPTINGVVPEGVDPTSRFNTPYDDMRFEAFDLRLEYRARLTDRVVIANRFGVIDTETRYFSAELLSPSEADPNVIDREYLFFHHQVRPISNQLEVSTTAQALGEHRLSAGHDLGTFRWSTPSAVVPAMSIGLFGGAETQGEPDIRPTSVRTREQWTHGLFAQDLYAPHPSMRLLAGGRLDYWARTTRRDTLDPPSGTVTERGTSEQRDTFAPSGRLGLVLWPDAQVSPYASYSTSFKPVAVMPADGRQLEPETGGQLEAGARLEALGGRLRGTAALYQIDKRNLVIGRPMMIYEQAGAARSRGGELEVTADVGALSVRAGYALTRAEYVRFATGAGEDLAGRRLPFAPSHSATLWGRYRVGALQLGAGGRYQGESFADPENRVAMTDYVVVDAATAYQLGPLRLTLNIDNLLGTNPLDGRGWYYVSAINGTQLTPGAPRTALVQLHYTY